MLDGLRPPPTLMLPMVIEDGIGRGGVDVDVGIPMLAKTLSMFKYHELKLYNATKSVG